MARLGRLAAVALGFVLIAPFATAPLAARADTTLTIAGSTALLPLAKAAAETYQQQHADVKINVSGGGSGVGITQVAQKAVDIGNSDIPAKGQPGLVDHKVCVTGFSIVVNASAGVKNLTTKQVQDIFSAKVTNWKDVGGKDQKIVVINRPRNSGTRATFVATVMGGVPVSEAGLVEDATGTVVATVKNTPGAVTYAGFGGTHHQTGIVEISLDGVAATDANVMTGKYKFWSYEHMFTNGRPTPAAAAFIDYVAKGGSLINQLGYITVGDMKVVANDR
jgi:phosphate transport system substrate-binding protein